MTPQTLPLSDGRRVRALVAGAGAPVLLVHGVGLRAEAWAPQIECLRSGARIVAVDLPGHGGSDPLGAEARLPDFVAWAALVVTALDLGPVSVAGHSMGALISLGLAVDHPAQVRRAALLNAVHRRSPEARAAVLARAAEIAAGQGRIDGPLGRWFTEAETPLRDQVASWLSGVDPAGYATAYRAFAEGDEVYAGRLGHLRCPLLVLTGAEDANSTPEMTQAMASLAPRGQARVIAGHRHMVNLTAPDQVNQALQDWLAKQEMAA